MTQKQIDQKFNTDISKAVNALKKYNPEKIILYGSVARGDFTKDSDIDILIIKDGVDKIKPHLRVYQALRMMRPLTGIEPKVYSSKEFAYRIKNDDFYLKEAVRQGKVLYEKT